MTQSRVWPLTPLQRGLLAHDELSRGTAPGEELQRGSVPREYIGQATLLVHGPLEVERLLGAAVALLEEHPQLRAGFLIDAELDPVQFIEPFDSLPGADRLVRLSVAREGEELDAAAARIAAAELEEGFSLDSPPLLRWHLVRAGEGGGDQGRLLLSAHHMILDGWSMPVMVRALADAASLPRREAAPSADYEAHLALLAAGDREAALEHWRSTLGHLLDERPQGWCAEADGGHASGAAAGEERLRMDPATVARLRERAAAQGLSEAAVVRGCFALALDWLAGQAGTPFVTPVHGRDPRLPGVENTPGLFADSVIVSSLPVAAQLGEAIEQLEGEFRAGLPHHHVGLGGILAALALRDPARALFAYERPSGATATIAPEGTELTLAGVLDASHYPLQLTAVAGEPGGLELVAEYDGVRVQSQQARRLLGALEALVSAYAQDPSCQLADVQLLTVADAALVRAAARSPRPRDGESPLLRAAWAQAVAEHAGRIALRFDDGQWNFAELDRRAREAAGTLRAAGAGIRRAPVVLHLERSPEAVVMLLGSILAGAVTLVLDPKTPQQRVNEVLEDTGAGVLVSSDGVCPLEPRAPGEDAGDRSACCDAAAAAVGEVRNELAFLVLTSGSTGRPKPVAITHGAMAEVLAHHRERLWPAGGVLAHSNSLHFDAHWDALLGLFAGHTVRLLSSETVLDPYALGELLAAEPLDYLDLGPAVWASHLAAGTLPRLPALSVAGGEAFPPALWRELGERAASEGTRVMNLYGPTENTIDALGAQVHASPEPRVGTPIGATGAVVLDERLRALAPGTEGELYLAGEQLALGYFGLAALTSERFVAAPGAALALGVAGAGERLYRTGDRAFLDEDGSFALLGRSDNQLSINGFRIEPGEVAAAMLALPGVSEAHVGAVKHPLGGRRLVAWSVGPASPEAVRSELAAALPPHLVPSTVLSVERFPITSNGKLDERALPQPAWLAPAGAGSGGASLAESNPDDAAQGPASGGQSWLLQVVLEEAGALLGAPAVSGATLTVQGGDSITAVRLSAILRRRGIALSAGELLVARSLAEAAARASVVAEPAQASSGLERAVAPAGATEPGLPLVASQEGMYVHSLASAPDPYRTTTRFSVRGPGLGADHGALLAAWASVEEAHPVLRSAFLAQPDGTVRCHPGAAEPAPQHVIDARDLDAEGQRAALERAQEVALGGQDVAAGRLSAPVWVPLDDGSVELFLGLHHLLVDGWSTGLIAEALREALAGRALPIDRGWEAHALAVGAADVAAWETLMLASVPEEAGTTLVLPLLERAASLGQRPGGVLATWVPVPTDAERLLGALRGQGITPATALVLAWGRTVAELARGNADAGAVIGVVGSGREGESVGIESAVGPFLTTRPLAVPAGRLTARSARELALDLSNGAQAALLGPARLRRLLGERHDALVVIENYPRTQEPAALLQVNAVSGTDRSGAPLTLTASTHDLALEVDVDVPGAAPAQARAILGTLVRELAAVAGIELDGGANEFTVHPAGREAATPLRVEEGAPGAAASAEGPAALAAASSAPGGLTEALVGAMAETLGAPAHAETDFFAAGGDSILAMSLVAAARRVGAPVSIADVFAAKTPAALAARLVSRGTVLPVAETDGGGELPLTSGVAWYAEHIGEAGECDPFIQLRVLRLPKGLSDATLEAALTELVRRHEALRLALRWPAGDASESATLRILAPAPQQVVRVEPGVEAMGTVRREALRLSPQAGRLLAAVRDGDERLVLLLHHLCVDALSWPVLVHELRSLCEGRPVGAAPSYAAAARAEASAARRLAPAAGRLSALLDAGTASVAAAGHAAGPVWNTGGASLGEATHGEFRLSAAATAAAFGSGGSGMDAVLAAGLSAALEREAVFEFESHGRPLHEAGDERDGLDWGGLVGWFTKTWTLRLPAPERVMGRTAGAQHLADVARQVNAARPLALDAVLAGATTARGAEVLLNYLGGEGEADAEKREWAEAADAAAFEEELALGRSLPLSHPLEINAGLRGEQLVLSWSAAPSAAPAIPGLLEALEEYFVSLSVSVQDGPAAPGAGRLAPLNLAALGPRDLGFAASEGAEAAWPASPGQIGLAFQALGDEADTYVSRTEVRLAGDVHPECFVAAVAATAAAEPALRQRWVAGAAVPHLLSWEGAGPEARLFHGDGADAAAEAWLKRPWMLDVATPLSRWALVEAPGDAGAGGYRLILADHHVILDGWSVPLVVERLFAAWAEAVRGEGGPTEAQPLTRHPLVAHVLAQDPQASEAALAAWDAALPQAPGVLVPGLVAGTALAEGTVDLELGALASRWRSTPAQLLTLAWGVALCAAAGERRLLLGQVVSGRSADEASLVGMFVGSAPVLVDVTTDVDGALEAVATSAALAAEHPDAPLTELARGRGRAALFDSLIVVENYPHEPLAEPWPGMWVSDVLGEDATHYPVALTAEPHAEGMSLRVEVPVDDARFGGTAGARAVLEALRAVLVELTRASGGDAASRLLEAASRTLPLTAPAATTSTAAREVGADGDIEPAALAAARSALAVALGADPGPEGNFFALGGDSVAAMAIVIALRARGFAAAPSLIFAHPTANELAPQLRRLGEPDRAPSKPGGTPAANPAASSIEISADAIDLGALSGLLGALAPERTS